MRFRWDRPAWGVCARVLPALLAVAAWCAVPTAWAQPPGGQTPVDTTAAERAVQALNPKYKTTYNVTQQRRIWAQSLNLGLSRESWTMNGETTFDINKDLYQDAINRSGRVNLSLTSRKLRKLPLVLKINYNRNNFSGQDSRDDVSSSVSLGATHTRRFLGGPQTLRIEAGLEGQEQENTNRNTQQTAITSNNGVRGSANWDGSFKLADWVSASGKAAFMRAELTSKTTDREAPTYNQNQKVSGEISVNPSPRLSGLIKGNIDKNDYVKTRSVGGADAFVTTNTKNQSLNVSTTYKTPWRMEIVGDALVSENQNLQRPDSDDPNLQSLVRNSVTRNRNQWMTQVTGELWGANYESRLSSEVDETIKFGDDPSELHTNRWEGNLNRGFGTTERNQPRFKTKIDFFVELRQQIDFTAPKRRFDYDERRNKIAFNVDWNVNTKWLVGSTFEANTKDRIEQNPRRAKATLNQQLQSFSTYITYNLSNRTRLRQNYAIVADFREKQFDTARNSSTISRRITTDIYTAVLPKVDINFVHRWSLLESSSFLNRPTGLVVFPQSKTWSQDLAFKLEWRVFPWLSWLSEEQLIRRDLLREIDQVKTRASRDFRLTQGIKLKRELGTGFSVQGEGRYQRSSTRASFMTITAQLDKEF